MLDEGRLYRAINQNNGVVLADRLRVARTFKSRSVGLLNRTSLETGEALLIEPCTSIHTFFMKFSIDVLFLDKEGYVVKIARNIKPWKLAGCLWGGYMVMEFSSGARVNDVVFKGNKIKIEENI